MQMEAGGHGFSATREIRGLSDILDKTGSVKLVATEAAQNALTHAQEFSWGDIFMSFNYQNKGGRFFANGRPVENISSANEVGGDRMGRVMTALDAMIQDENIAESIVVSEDLGFGRHFIYRYRKAEEGSINGLAFEYQGTTEELGKVVNELSKRAIDFPQADKKFSFDFSKPLFFTEESKNNEADLARAAHNSFDSGERRRDMKKYLDRLDRDTTQFKELMSRRQSQEEELKEQYEKMILRNPDAKTGIANAVYGMIDTVEKMTVSESRRREGVGVFEISQIPSGQTPYDLAQKHGLRVDAVKPNLDNPVGRGEESEKAIKQQEFKKTENQVEELDILETLKPVFPGIIGLSLILTAFQENGLVVDGEVENSALVPAPRKSVFEGRFADEALFWQELISAVFVPVLYNAEIESAFLADDEGSTGFSDALISFIPVVFADEAHQSSLGRDGLFLREDSKKQDELVIGFQRGIEVVARLVETKEDQAINLSLEGNNKQKNVENDIVVIGQGLLRVLISEPKIWVNTDKAKPKENTRAKLAFLLRIYEDSNSTELVKSFIAALIYKQIQQLKEGRLDFNENPEILDIFGKFDKLFPFTSFLEERFNLLVSVLQNFYPGIFFDDGKKKVDEELIGKMIFVICQMAKKEEIYSFEKLSITGLLNPKNISFKQYRNNNQRKKVGIIFRFNGKIIYQYSQYLSAQLFV